MSEESMICGVVESVIFKNDENGYAVLKLIDEDGSEIIAVGCVPFPGIGEYIEAEGTWTNHQTYGNQFCITAFHRTLPSSAPLILEYLSSQTIRGVGRKTAEKIVDVFGDDTLYIIDKYPKRLCEVAGITAKKAEEIGKQFQLRNSLMILMEFLSENGLEPEIAVSLFRCYGKNAISAVRENPYILSDAEIGVPFYKADKLAIDMGFDGSSRERVTAAVLYELRFNSESGHTFIPQNKLSAITSNLINIDEEDVYKAIERLILEGEITKEEICGVSACYLTTLYEDEAYVARRLATMSMRNERSNASVDELIKKAEAERDIVFNDMQKNAIDMAINSSIMLLTGGPGTGKTTVIQGMLSSFERLKLRVMLAAPTGRAAKRMSEFCKVEAKTIHRMLEIGYDDSGERMFFARDEENKLEADVLIIDEMSMVDISLFAATLRALPQKCKLILVGDADQLPSVGAGNVFNDVLNSGCFPTVRLTHIFRQAAQSDIIVGAHDVNGGKLPDLTKKDNDLFFLRRTNDEDIVKTVLELCKTRLPKNMNIPSSQIQVLSVSRKGEIGTNSLNFNLQRELNPAEVGKDEKRIGERLFRIGDRVMQIKNNYTATWYSIYGDETGYGVFNGDIGEVISIDEVDETITVNFDSRLVHYPFSGAHELEHAYAMTVHKSQGSEFRAVVLIAGRSAPQLLHRSVLYTAMTRARELLIIVGDGEVIKYMVENNKQRKRYSALRARITELCN